MRRAPTDEELDLLFAYRAAQLRRFRSAPSDATSLVHVGVTPVDLALNQVELAALTLTAAGVFNTPDAYSQH